jgi:hypothetical protein
VDPPGNLADRRDLEPCLRRSIPLSQIDPTEAFCDFGRIAMAMHKERRDRGGVHEEVSPGECIATIAQPIHLGVIRNRDVANPILNHALNS